VSSRTFPSLGIRGKVKLHNRFDIADILVTPNNVFCVAKLMKLLEGCHSSTSFIGEAITPVSSLAMYHYFILFWMRNSESCMKERTLRNVNICCHTKISFYLETLVKIIIFFEILFIFSTPVLIRHLLQLKIVVFLHKCLICAVLFLVNFNAWVILLKSFRTTESIFTLLISVLLMAVRILKKSSKFWQLAQN